MGAAAGFEAAVLRRFGAIIPQLARDTVKA